MTSAVSVPGVAAHRQFLRDAADLAAQHQPATTCPGRRIGRRPRGTPRVQRNPAPEHHAGRFADPVPVSAPQRNLRDQRRSAVMFVQFPEVAVHRAISPLPPAVVADHLSRRKGHADGRVVEALRERPQRPREQPVVAVDELDAVAACVFQAPVVIAVEAGARTVADEPVPWPEQARGEPRHRRRRMRRRRRRSRSRRPPGPGCCAGSARSSRRCCTWVRTPRHGDVPAICRT